MALQKDSRAFLDYLDRFLAELPTESMAAVAAAAGGGERVALISVDLICGFAKCGPLASPRVDATLPAVVRTMRAAAAAGVREVCFLQDAHPEDALEFQAFGPHCVRGTAEAEMVPELADILRSTPLRATVVGKNSISGVHAPGFQHWEARMRAAGVHTYVVVGDCTDLCVSNLVLPLKTRANHEGRPLDIVLPEDCLSTYDLPVAAAAELGVLPHDGPLLHAVFLYQMALNGCRVVRSLT